MYGNPTDPTPYIAAAYIIGLLLIGGYALWLFLDRKKTQKLLDTLNRKNVS